MIGIDRPYKLAILKLIRERACQEKSPKAKADIMFFLFTKNTFFSCYFAQSPRRMAWKLYSKLVEGSPKPPPPGVSIIKVSPDDIFSVAVLSNCFTLPSFLIT